MVAKYSAGISAGFNAFIIWDTLHAASAYSEAIVNVNSLRRIVSRTHKSCGDKNILFHGRLAGVEIKINKAYARGEKGGRGTAIRSRCLSRVMIQAPGLIMGGKSK